MQVSRNMNINKNFYCCISIIHLIVYDASGFPHNEELHEGTGCTTQSGVAGIYKKLQECPPEIVDVVGRSSQTEIVCCPQGTSNKPGIRANAACREYATNVDDGLKGKDIEKKNLDFHILGRVDEFPHMAALGYENIDGDTHEPIVFMCGGTLISSRYVLTAAHCVSNILNRVPVKVRLGSMDLKSTSKNIQDIAVNKIIVHPLWKRPVTYNDIALLRLAESAKLYHSVRPICLQTKPLPNSLMNDDTSFVIIGFRGSDDSDKSTKELMKTANISLVPTNICSNSYSGFRKLPSGINNNMICALDSNWKDRKDVCYDEMLGPLLMISKTTQTLIGVPSFGQICNGPAPDVYTSVYSYLDWIESEVWPEQNQA